MTFSLLELCSALAYRTGRLPAGLLEHAVHVATAERCTGYLILGLLLRDDLPAEAVETLAETLAVRSVEDEPVGEHRWWQRARAALLLRPGRYDPQAAREACLADPELAVACTHIPSADEDLIVWLAGHPNPAVRAAATGHPRCPAGVCLAVVDALDEDADRNEDALGAQFLRAAQFLRTALRGPVAREHACEILFRLRTTSAMVELFTAPLTVDARRHALTTWLPAAIGERDVDVCAEYTLLLLGADDGPVPAELLAAAADGWRPHWQTLDGRDDASAQLRNLLVSTIRGGPGTRPAPHVRTLRGADLDWLVDALPPGAERREFWQALEALSNEFRGNVSDLLTAADGIARTPAEAAAERPTA